MKSNLHNKLFQVKVLIIHEISMVSNDSLLHVHCWLVKIFGCRTDIPFVGITNNSSKRFFAVANSTSKTPIYAEYKNDRLNFATLWEHEVNWI